MATSLSATTTVNKLNGDNWSTWKFETRIVLNGQGLFEIVSGKKLKPETPSEATSWVRDDAKAQSIIVTRMEPGPQAHILSCETAHQMWTKLKSVYDKESTVSIHLLQQRFFTMQFNEGSVSDFLSKLEEIRVKLKQAGETISDKMAITKILMSLPEQYKYFRSAWESAPSEKQTLDELTSRLLIEEERNKNGTEQDVAIAHVTHESKCLTCGKAGHMKKDCYKNKTCEFCKKPGHISKYCFFRKNNKSKKQVSPIALVASQLEQLEDCYYMDSGCSQHMSRSKHLFHDYEELQDHPVQMGDGATINAIGIGNVRLEAFNGHKWQEVELKQVLHVPDLKVNLFSAASCLDKGLQMVSDNNLCKFIKNNEVVTLARREGRLFKMMFRMSQQTMALSSMSYKVDVCNNNKSKKGMFMGYGDNTKGYEIYYPENKTFSIGREVISSPTMLTENTMADNIQNVPVLLETTDTDEQNEETTRSVADSVQGSEDELVNTCEVLPSQEEIEDPNCSVTGSSAAPISSAGENNNTRSLRSRNTLRPPANLQDYDMSYFTLLDTEEPTSLKEAKSSPNASKWEEAMKAEMKALAENDTWTFVEKPDTKIMIMDTKWVFKIKRNNDNKIDVYKGKMSR